MSELHDHFATHGWARLAGAFPATAAAAMRDVVWAELERGGLRRDDPSTWRAERPTHLQDLKADPAFAAVGSPVVLDAVRELVGEGPQLPPSNWGAFFLVFPDRTPRPWGVASDGWHVDAPYDDALDPPGGLKVHAMFGDVAPRTGGAMQILSGSHRLVHRWFERHPPRAGARSRDGKKALLRGVPYLRDLAAADGDPGSPGRIERFLQSVEEVDGIPLQVRENTAAAGDVLVMHSLLLHSPPPSHAGTEPRFLLNKDLRRA